MGARLFWGLMKTVVRLCLLTVCALIGSCSTIGLDGGGTASGTDAQLGALGEAIGEVARIFENSLFLENVKARHWLISITSSRTVSGSQLADELGAVAIRAQTYKVRPIFGCHTYVPLWEGTCTASTSFCSESQGAKSEGTVNLNNEYVDRALSGELVNTVAHELTHTIGNGYGLAGCMGAKGARYRDGTASGGPDRTMSQEAWLVSYTIGDIAQCVHSSADKAEFERCFAWTQNSRRRERRMLECCSTGEEGASGPALEILRSQTKCPAVTCPEPRELLQLIRQQEKTGRD